MSLWTAQEIAAATGGSVHGDFKVDAVTFDSREIVGGELFIAMKGESNDGHAFVMDAKARGASGFLVSETVDAPHVRVPDGLAGLEALGRAARKRTKGTIFGVTGSVGKTSVKEALRYALSEIEPADTHWSVKSYNNHTGVPLSLSRMPAGTRFGIFEMGMNHAGELSSLTQMVRPHVAIVTWVAAVHLEFFKDEAAIADAKAEIFEGLQPDGAAVIPFDNPHRDRLLGKAKAYAERIITFGSDKGADVRLLRAAEDTDGSTVIADVAGNTCGYRVSMPGTHWVQNSLAVMAAAYAAGADLAAAALGLSQINGMAGRGERHKIAVDGGDAELIDESYNANPTSMAATLAMLGRVNPSVDGRRIAILGTMGELGPDSDRFHAGLAPDIAAARVKIAILVGSGMAALADKLPGVDVISVDDAATALAEVRRVLVPGDVVLVKGSNSVGLGAVVAALKEAKS